MASILERLRTGPVLVLDGGLGTMLIARGLKRGEPPERWNLERPADLVRIHREYVGAGSDAIHANTFGANRIRLARYGLESRLAEINGAGVRLAREAGPRYVIADVGPTGEYLPPVGQGDEAAWREAFEEQGSVLAEAGADALHIETMSDLREARIAAEALKKAAPSIPVFASLTFDRKKRGFFTVMGDPLAASLQNLAGITDAVGVNCTLASADMRDLAIEARAAVAAPLIVQPNAGSPQLVGDALHYAQSPEAYAEDAAAIVQCGANAIGGCCGTDPRFIAALCRLLGVSGCRS